MVRRDQFGFIVIGLVAHRVPAFVTTKIQVAGGRHALPQRLHQCLVIGVGGADETIEADAQRLIEFTERGHHLIDIGLGRHAGGPGGLIDLQAMLVGSGEEAHIKAIKPLEAGDDIGGNRFIGMAHVRPAVGISDGAGDVITGFRHDHGQCGKLRPDSSSLQAGTAARCKARRCATCPGSSCSGTASRARRLAASHCAMAAPRAGPFKRCARSAIKAGTRSSSAA